MNKQIIAKVLKSIGLHSSEAVDLIFETGVHESTGYKYRRQMGNGPALGYWQMETATHDDCWDNFLKYKPSLSAKILTTSGLNSRPEATELINNDAYAICMCRVKYLRAKGAIPKTIEGRAKYWKDNYNTAKGKGTVEKYLNDNAKYNHHE